MLVPVEKIWLDGKLVPWAQATVHVMTHTLHYGMGAFEGIRCYLRADGSSSVFRLDDHVDRLFDTCQIIGMRVPFSRSQIRDASLETLAANKLREAYLRPMVFYGEGPLGVYPTEQRVRVAVIAIQWGAYLGEEGLRKGIRAKISSFTRQHVNATMAKGKVMGHYVNSILAKQEAKSLGYEEAILLDAQGYVAEASGENIFVVRRGEIRTPAFGGSLLGGITRDTVMQIARESGLRLVETPITRDELYINTRMRLGHKNWIQAWRVNPDGKVTNGLRPSKDYVHPHSAPR